MLGWLSTFTKAAAKNRFAATTSRSCRSTGSRFAPLICFESAFPDLSRRAALDGAELLVFQSSTTTFQGSWVPDQHASLAAVRAVETGRPAVQATLAGTTAAFDAHGPPAGLVAGRDRAPSPSRYRWARVDTPYDRLGDWVPAWCFAALAATAIGLSLTRRTRNSSPHALPATRGRSLEPKVITTAPD